MCMAIYMCVQCPGRPAEGVTFLDLELQNSHTCAKNRECQPWVLTMGTKSIPGGYS